jgi:TP901 family phage tail tape measure protein
MQTLADSSQSMSSRFQAAGQMLTRAGSTLTACVTVPLAGMGAASVKTAADFESSMSNVQALSGATGSELEQLSNLAKEMGATTQFSASEAADALGYMALAGWDTQQSMNALPGVLNLAAASGMGLAEASDLVTDYLSAFGEEADQAGRMADVLSYAQANSNTTTAGLGEAFKNCAANANAFGLDIEQTTALIGKLSDQGLKGSEAGTALSAVFRDITQKMKDGNITIGKTKIAVQDANGNYRSMTDILRDVENATDGMGDAQKNAALMSTFTSDSLKALNILLQTGSGNIEDFEKELRNSSGTAEEMANIMNDNLNGQITALKSALEGAAIAIGEALLPMIKGLVSVLQGALNWFNGLNDGVKTTIVTVGLVVAAIGPLLLILGSLASAIGNLIELKALLAESSILSSAIGRVSGLFTSLGAIITGTVIPALQSLWAFMLANPITLVIAAIAALVAGFIYLWNNCESFRNFWINLWDNIVETVQNIPTYFENALNAIGDTFNSIKETITTKLSETWQSITTWCSDTYNSFIEWGTNLITNIGNWFNELPSRIGYALGFALGTIASWIVNTWNYFTTNIPKWIESIGQWFSELPGKIGTWLTNTYNNVISWGSNMLSKAIETGTNFVNNVVNFIKNLPTTVYNWLTQTYNKAVNWATQMLNKAREAGSNFVSKVGSTIQSLPGKVWSYLSQTISKAVTFVSQFGQKATQAARNFTTNIVNGVRNIPNQMLSIGRNIVQGIWRGISGAAGWLRSQISNFASGIINGFKSAFKINSPSKIMRDIIGKGIVEGIGVGIDNEEDSLLTKADKLAGSVVDVMSGNIATTNLLNTAKNLTTSMNIATNQATGQDKVSKFDSLLHVENLTINDDKDIETLASDLAFYLKRKNVLTV